MAGDDVVRLVDIKYTTAGADQVASANKKVSDSLDGVAVASDRSSKASLSVERSYDGLQKKYDVVYRATQQQTAEQTKLDTARKQGLVSDERYTFLQGQIAQGYQTTVSAAGKAGAATAGFTKDAGLARHELVSLSRQAQDVAVSLGSGQSFGTVLLQQGTQIADVFATSGGTVRGFFSQVVSGAAALITPTTVAVATVVALGAAAGAAAIQMDRLQVSSQRAITGAGQRTGTTVGDLNQFVSQNSGVAGTGLSNKEARDLAEDFTKTGEIVVSRLHGMSDAVVGFSNQTGQSMSDASKAMVGFAVDPKKALDELAKTYGSFDIATRKAVDALVLADDKTGAFQVVIDALSEKSKKAADNMGFFEKAARGVVNVLSTEATKPRGLEGEIEVARGKLNAAIEGAPSGGDARAAAASADIARLSKEYENLFAAGQKVKDQQVSAEFNNVADKARLATDALIPQIEQLKQMELRLNQLKAARDAGAGGPNNDAAITAIRNQIAALQDAQGQAERYNQRVAVISTSWGNVGQSTALALQAMHNALPVAQAWTESGRMLAQQQATLNALIDQGKTGEEASAIAAQQYDLAKASAVANAQKLVQSSEDNLDKIRAQGTGMEGVVAASIAARDALQGGATATQAAAISANTLAANMLQAAKNAQQVEQSAIDAANLTTNGIVTADSFAKMQANANNPATSQFYVDGKQHESTSNFGWAILKAHNFEMTTAALRPASLSEGIDKTYQKSGLDSALTYAMGQKAGPQVLAQTTNGAGGSVPYSAYGLSDVVTKPAMSQSEIISQVSSLYELKNAQTSDKSQQRANLQEELAWLQSQPQNLDVTREIINLTSKIKDLTDATVDNTAAMVSWNPLYTQGRSALRVGYMGAANGFSGVVTGGIPGVDSVPLNIGPYNIMAQKDELVQVHPVGWQKNLAANSNGSSPTIINQTNHFSSSGGNGSRLSELQLAQGFGQIASAMSRR